MNELSLNGEEYVVLPKAEFLRLTGKAPRNEALEFVLAALGQDLKAARVHAGLTQEQLAKKLKKAQTTVSQSEAGLIRVSEAYVKSVMKACKLPTTWKKPATP